MKLDKQLFLRLRTNIGWSCTAGVVLAILAPLNTDTYTAVYRAIYWIGLCFAGGIGASLFEISKALMDKTPRPWESAFGSSIGATVAVAIFLLFPYKDITLVDFTFTMFYILVISLVISIFILLWQSRHSHVEMDNNREITPAIFERLSFNVKTSEIYAIRSEDHYVRVYTSKGDEMILMRLSDAIKETKPLKGVQTHRSWWVAEAGVKNVERAKGKTLLTLKNNIPALVSNSGSKAIKGIGWL